MTDKNTNTTSNIPHSANVDIPRRPSLFGSIFGTLSGSPTNTMTIPRSSEYAIEEPSSAGGKPLDTSTARPRAMSEQGISADEALNLSRANSKKTQTNAHGRRASRGRFEGMGLIAAFSGGPSSF